MGCTNLSVFRFNFLVTVVVSKAVVCDFETGLRLSCSGCNRALLLREGAISLPSFREGWVVVCACRHIHHTHGNSLSCFEVVRHTFVSV